VFPAAAQVQVDFSPSNLNLNLGESALVEVTVTGVPAGGLAAFQFTLDFNPQSIDILNPNEAFRGTVFPFAPLGGDPLCTTVRGTGTCNDPDWFLISTGRTPLGLDTIDNAAGRVEVVYGTSGAPAPPTGNGTIALIEVFAPWDGTTTVNLSDVILADNQEPPVPFGVTLGSLTVTSGSGVANVAPVLTPIGNQQLYENQVLSVPISSSDPDGDNLTLSATGLPSFCNLSDNGDGTGSLDCAPLIGDDGVHAMTIRTTDDGGPNLEDNEAITITVDITTCVDADSDGFGFPGDISCPKGSLEDCDDAAPAVNPDAVEFCRNGVDDDCNGDFDASEALCAGETCIVVTLGSPGSDPTITMGDTVSCPYLITLARSVDVIWGDFAALAVVGPDVRLGAVTQINCADTAEGQLFDNLIPVAGELDFYLVRETGVAEYGTSSSAEPRLPDSGDCP
jgi:hypothetical protein